MLPSFPDSIRRARNDTREKSRIRIRRSRPLPRASLSCVDGRANNVRRRGDECPARLLEWSEMTRGFSARGKRNARNQSNRFFFPPALFIRTRRNKEMIFPTRSRRRGKKVSSNRFSAPSRLPLGSPFAPYPPPPSISRETRACGVRAGAVKLSFGYQRDATPRARIRAREVIWLSETQTLLSAVPQSRGI